MFPGSQGKSSSNWNLGISVNVCQTMACITDAWFLFSGLQMFKTICQFVKQPKLSCNIDRTLVSSHVIEYMAKKI